MKNILFLLVTLFGIQIQVFSQQPLLKLIGSHFDNELRDIALLPDKSILVTGVVAKTELPIMKFDSIGNLLWAKQYKINTTDPTQSIIGNSILVTSNQRITISGEYLASGTGGILILQTDLSGNLLWARVIPGITDGLKVVEDDHSLYIIGSNQGPFSPNWEGMIIKMTLDGTVQWMKRYHNNTYVVFKDLIVTADGGLVLTGQAQLPHGQNPDPVIIRLNDQGDPMWSRVIFNAAGLFEGGATLTMDKSGNLYVGGNLDLGGNSGAFLAKYTSTGNREYLKLFQGNETSTFTLGTEKLIFHNSTLHSVVWVNNFDGPNPWAPEDIHLLEINTNGSIIGTKQITGDYSEIIKEFEIDQDGNYYISGWTTSYTQLGNKNGLLWKGTQASWGCKMDSGFITGQDASIYFPDSSIQIQSKLVTVTLDSADIIQNVLPIMLDTLVCSPLVSNIQPLPELGNIEVFPNPVFHTLFITNHEPTNAIHSVQVFDALGKLCFASIYSSAIDIQHLPDGIYIGKVFSDKGVGTFKVCKRTP